MTGSGTPASARMRWNGFYALNVHPSIDALARSWRRFGRRVRGKTPASTLPTSLPDVAWSDIFQRRAIALSETRRSFGNATLLELAILAHAAAEILPASEIIEIGTFDGRTTLNLALNAPPTSPIFTLDLPPEQATQFQLEAADRVFVDKPAPGARFRQARGAISELTQRIRQLYGDSATFDWSAHEGKAGLVFVDGSHAYDYVCADSITALRLVRAGGRVLWHDYGVWAGVTRALEELEQEKKLGLRHIRGTSLAVWQAPS